MIAHLKIFSDDSYLKKTSFAKAFHEVILNLDDVDDLTVMDLGCGDKPYKHLFQKNQYVGVDIRQNKRNNVDIIYDGRNLPISDKTFDIILCTQVVYQVEDEEKILNELIRVLKPNGYLILSLPFMWFDSHSNMERRYSSGMMNKLMDNYRLENVCMLRVCTGSCLISTLLIKSINAYFLKVIDIAPDFLRLPLRVFRATIICMLNLAFKSTTGFSTAHSDLYSDTILVAKNNKNVK